MRSAVKIKFLLIVFIFSSGEVFGQEFMTPRLSPYTVLTQVVGVSKVKINYSRPAVRDRVIWGGLVPYDQIWRTGANENTTIEFEHPVEINGYFLDAGKYGLHTIPNEDEWTVIFSYDNDRWGSMSYNKNNDALRIKVKPRTAEQFKERMTFDFVNLTDTSADVLLWWEYLQISFTTKFETDLIVMRKFSEKVDWTIPHRGATYLLEKDLDKEAALEWIDISIEIDKNYYNLEVKAEILYELGREDEAIKVLKEAIEIAENMTSPPPDLEETKKLLEKWD